MVYGFLLLLLVAGQAFWTVRLHRREAGIHLYALGTASIYLLFAAIGYFGTLQLVKYTCDESCYEGPDSVYKPGPDWVHAREAWQWDALPLLAGAGLAAVVLSILFLAARWYRGSLAWLGVSAAVYTPFVVLFAQRVG